MIGEKSSSSQVYVDTCVISGCVKNDMKSTDINAFQMLIQMSQNGKLIISASTVAREELEQIPTPYVNEHIAMYETLKIVKGAVTTWINDDPLSTGFRQKVNDVDYIALQRILPDVNDARHLFQAKKAGITDIITVDYRSILSKKTALEKQCGLRVYSPSGYLESYPT